MNLYSLRLFKCQREGGDRLAFKCRNQAEHLTSCLNSRTTYISVLLVVPRINVVCIGLEAEINGKTRNHVTPIVLRYTLPTRKDC